MTARVLDGKALGERIRSEVASDVADLTKALGRPPGLDVVLVGDDPASQVYVRNKQAACRKAGMRGAIHRLPAEAAEAELLDLVDRLNADHAVDGILVQLPLPAHVRERRVIERVDPRKDVDGFHPINAGLLAIGQPRFVPCTPLGVQRLLLETGVPIRGAHIVVIGRSNIVGKPIALLLLQKGDAGDATVTICHTQTRDPAALAREADVLIVAMGRPEAVGADWVKPGAVVIDVGIHRHADGSLRGDVKSAEVAEKAAWLTPVPGGVGPMTIAMLLRNTAQAARMRLEGATG